MQSLKPLREGCLYVAQSRMLLQKQHDSARASCDLCGCPVTGLALPAGQHPDLDPSKVAERPRVLYNEATDSFVMWMHIDTADYELASCGMATSPTPTGEPAARKALPQKGPQRADFDFLQAQLVSVPADCNEST